MESWAEAFTDGAFVFAGIQFGTAASMIGQSLSLEFWWSVIATVFALEIYIYLKANYSNEQR